MPDHSFINLYHELRQGIELSKTNVLQVGCGRGGGCYYLAKYHNVAKVTGIDLSKANISISKDLHDFSNLSFKQRNAVDFCFEDGRFNLIFNLESLHRYSSKADFFKCVYESLTTDRIFAYADLFNGNRVERSEGMLADAGFVIEAQKDITAGVVASIDLK